MALLCTHPGASLLSMMEVYREAVKAGAKGNDPLFRALDSHLSHFHEGINTVLNNDLPQLVKMQEGRQPLDAAVRRLAGRFEAALKRRKTDRIFDVGFLMATGAQGFKVLQDEFPPCDAMQERYGDEKDICRDTIYAFEPDKRDENGFMPSDGARSLQAQQVFVRGHLKGTNFVETSKLQIKCPFFHACPLPFRRTSSSACLREPWTLFGGLEPGVGCWFSSAVAATVGPVKAKVIDGV